MTGRGVFLLAVVAAMAAGPAVGQAPLQPRPPHEYDIHPGAGAWAILVKSYTSEPAKRDKDTGAIIAPSQAFVLAFELVSELRRDNKLPAYFFDRSEEARREEETRLAAQRTQRQQLYQQLGAKPEISHFKKQQTITDQYAVLVAANYPTMDAARMDLERIRKLKPPSERLLDKGWRVLPGNGTKAPVEQAVINPFVTAFVVPNPTVPRPKNTEPDKQEEISLRELNSDESYSLLHKCPGKWTLVVKVYRGPTIIMSRESEKSVLEKIGFGGKKGGDMMSACAKSAHQLAEILRNKQLNYESYVLHTRDMSLVTVGSFTSEKDPRMLEMMNTIGKLRLEPYETLMNPPQPFHIPK